MRLLLIGRGRMGQLVEHLAPAHGCEIAGVITSQSPTDALATGDFGQVDAAIDFSHGTAVLSNIEQVARRRWNLVIGTTGWQTDEAAARAIAEDAGIAAMAAANFSLGMNIFRMVVEEASRLFAGQPEAGAWIHELHHRGKRDAPSGTALMLRAAMGKAGFTRTIDVSSTRAGSIPGTHTIGFDAPAETVTLTHEVRDRGVFAHGAIEAAKWLQGRRGWFTVQDMIEDIQE